MMGESTRRAFFAQAALGAAATVATRTARVQANLGANQKVAIGLIGCGGRGTHMAQVMSRIPGVELVWLCDPDPQRIARAAERLSYSGGQTTGDLRRVLDDQRVDAVIVATPDHWHAPASIMACNAGKHVYVEKPCSHNIREGRLLVEAAQRNQRVVQHGTQCRSTGMIAEAVRMLHDGAIGDVLVCRVWNVQRRNEIGHGQPSEAPAEVDYDTWVGPAPLIPYQTNRFHDGWHWWYHFGTGDMGNDGVHDLDYALWGLGVSTHPSTVVALGGKFAYDDDQEFPDTQQVTFEYPGGGKPGERQLLIYEQRLWSTNYPHNVDSGVEFYGRSGQMFVSRRGKVQLLAERNQRVELAIEPEAQNEVAHAENFIAAIRTGSPLNAPAEVAHRSATVCHLGNLATRLGRSLRFDPEAERFVDDDEANQHLSRQYREHWGTPQQS